MNLNVGNITVSITGTLQGNNDLLRSSNNITNVDISISETGEIIAGDVRAVDIDGNGRTARNLTFNHSGQIWTKGLSAISAERTEDSVFTNTQTGSITSSDRTFMLNQSDNVTINNAGLIAGNNDNVTYRGGTLSHSRTSTDQGLVIVTKDSDDFTLVNSGTIESTGERGLFMQRSDDSNVTNSGTITGADNQLFYLDGTNRFTLTNSGTITGTTNVLYGANIDDSLITNEAGGTITGTDVTVYFHGVDNASLVNKGTLTATTGAAFDSRTATSSVLTNDGTIKTTTTGADYLISADNTVITNNAAGTLSSTANGVLLQAGNELKNYGTLSVADNGTA